jgi:eukaryotic-like serine/threonine-protein kinase
MTMPPTPHPPPSPVDADDALARRPTKSGIVGVDTDIPPELQTTLGDRYRIEREIGRGGMATVYLAEDTRHERMVALKVLHAELATAVGPRRFRREIAIAAQLQHPHILPLLDSGESADGPLWYTMPYVQGETLRQRLAREHQLPLPDAIRIASEIATALDYAHRRGVVHRDVKPENILLTVESRALLADFGVARDVINDLQPTRDPRLTDAGVSLGTLEYMSPEQTTGTRDVDGRTDVYALGCVLYEMLAGEPPFTGATPQALIARRLVERPLPLRAVRDRIPESIEHAVDVALARAPADRFQTAGAFAASLDEASRGAATTRGHATAAADRPPTPGTRTRRRVSSRTLALVTVALGVVAVGSYFAERHYRHAPAAPTPTKVAVLPFDNVGDTAAGYFTDGVTDEIRGKLATLPGLQVIARGSSMLYRRSAKPLQQIASELGVRYLLTGQVQWDRAGGRNRVRVNPELVEVTEDATPSVKWQQPFDIDVSDVLEVQSAIATSVATALNVALGSPQQQFLATRPTKNAAAYDAFLKGEAATQSLTSHDPASLRRGLSWYSRAVTFDAGFGLAWAQLGATQAALYQLGTPTSDDAQATAYAIERAQALAPDLPETLHAAADYEFYVRRDYDRVRSIDSAALARYPNDVSFLTAVASDEEDAGQFDAAVARLQRAQALDPRANRKALAHALLYLRRYPEAQAAFDARLAEYPTDLDALEGQAMIALGRGDLGAARGVLDDAIKRVGDTTAVLAYFADFYGLFWLPDAGQQERMLAFSPAAFGDDRGQWALLRAQLYWLHGDALHAARWADTARRVFAKQLQDAPSSATILVSYGEALAYLGRKSEAINEAERGAAISPISTNAFVGPFYQHVLARVYVVVGEPDKALDCLASLIHHPYVMSAGWLRFDPTWAPLRGDARFERLANGR